MIIIEAGGTSTQVVRIQKGSIGPIRSYPGISPTYMNKADIASILRVILKAQDADEDLIYYGAGCSQDSAKLIIKECIQSIHNFGKIEIASDLLAAARATANEKNGQINILGTGAASCIYKDKTIKQVLFNSGYLFGDYGSGFHLGQSFLRVYFEGNFDKKIEAEITSFSGVSKQELVGKIYGRKSPKRYIASFAQCIHHLKHHPHVNNIVQDSFAKFVQSQIALNPEYKTCLQYFVGSIAYYFSDELAQVMKASQLKIEDICASPIEKLIGYHMT